MRRVTLAYVVYFAAIGAGFPYLPVYYRSLGLDLGAVGAVTAVQAATQLVMAPVWGGLADAFPRTRMTLPLAAVVAAVGGAWLALVGILGGGLPVVVAGAVILFAGWPASGRSSTRARSRRWAPTATATARFEPGAPCRSSWSPPWSGSSSTDSATGRCLSRTCRSWLERRSSP